VTGFSWTGALRCG